MMLLAAQGNPQDLTGLVGWVIDVVSAFGPLGVGAMLVLETVFPPIPSEVVLPLSGYLASRGEMSFVLVLISSSLGALVGGWILYGLGRALGASRIDTLLRQIPLMEQRDLDSARDWFARHGTAAIFFGRFIPGVRSLISLPAGTEGMSLMRFSLYTLAGSGIWNLALVTAGYLLGRQWRSMEQYSSYLNAAVYVALALVVVQFAWQRRDRIGSTP
ncbi:MAG: DedA family protein [Egibacteraceae bacterium]